MKRLTLLLAATFVFATALTTACEEDDGGGANACEAAGQRILDKYESCGFELTSAEEGGEGGAECTDEIAMAAACTADCADEADCLALDPMPEDPTDQAYLDAVAPYGECVVACSM